MNKKFSEKKEEFKVKLKDEEKDKIDEKDKDEGIIKKEKVKIHKDN